MATRRDNGEGTKPSRRPDGKWRIQLRYTDPVTGQRGRKQLLGSTRDEVIVKRDEFRLSLRNGTVDVNSAMTVWQWCQHWIDTSMKARDITESSKVNYESLLRNHVKPTRLADVPLSKLAPSHIEAWLIELRARPAGQRRSETTHQRAFRALGTCLRTAHKHRVITWNPMAVVATPGGDTKEKDSPSVEEVLAVLGATRHTPLYAMWYLIAGTGMRKSEALALRWSDINAAEGSVNVRGTVTRAEGGGYTVAKPKTRKSKRVLHPDERVFETLKEHRVRQLEDRMKAGQAWVDEDWVFATKIGTRYHPRNALRQLQTAAKRAGITRPVDVHMLRHYVTTRMIASGVDPRTAADVLGHVGTETTMKVYTHMTDEQRKKALGLVGEVLPGDDGSGRHLKLASLMADKESQWLAGEQLP